MAEWSDRVWGVGFELSLKIGRDSSSHCFVGKYHALVVDVGLDWKPVEVKYTIVTYQDDIGYS